MTMKATLILLTLVTLTAVATTDAAASAAPVDVPSFEGGTRLHCAPGFEIICFVCTFVANLVGGQCN